MQPRRIYGLGVASAAPLAALAGLPPCDRLDLRWLFASEAPAFARVPEGEWQARCRNEESCVRVDFAPARGLHRLLYDDGTTFVVDARGSEVWASTPAGATLEDTATYLLGPVMGYVLRLRGITCLHASAVAFGDGAVAFAGHAGAGKSTLAAALAGRGHAVITEDVAALVPSGGDVEVEPAYPLVRLWPESVAALFGDAGALPLITPNWDKRFLALGEGAARFERRRLPLAAVCVLGGRSDAAARIERLEPARALMELVERAYSANLLDRAMRAREFEALSQLVRRVPVYGVTPAEGLDRLDALCELAESVGEHAPV